MLSHKTAVKCRLHDSLDIIIILSGNPHRPASIIALSLFITPHSSIRLSYPSGWCVVHVPLSNHITIVSLIACLDWTDGDTFDGVVSCPSMPSLLSNACLLFLSLFHSE